MNNSKKLKPKKEKKEKISDKPIKSISLPWIIVSVVLVVALIGGLIFDRLYEPTLITLDGKNYKLRDVSYYFYNVESSYSTYAQMLGANTWNMTYDEKSGLTYGQAAKNDMVSRAIYYEILYKEALKDGYKLTDAQQKSISTNVDKLLKETYPKPVIAKNHFTKKYLTKVVTKTTLVDLYRQDKIDALKIDKDKIKAGISYDDYRQYDVELLYISTQTTDDKGKTTDLSADKKAAAYDKIKALADKAKTSSDWSKLIPAKETDLTYKDTNFTPKSTTYSDNLKKMMMGMSNGQISDIYEDTTGYYVVRMKNNNSSESYDSAVKNAITNAQDTEFNKKYEKIKAEHTFTLHQKALGALKIGSITLPE